MVKKYSLNKRCFNLFYTTIQISDSSDFRLIPNFIETVLKKTFRFTFSNHLTTIPPDKINNQIVRINKISQ